MTIYLTSFALAIACMAGSVVQAQVPLDTSKYHIEWSAAQIDSLVNTIYVGKDLIVGRGSRENGWYKAMAFKSAFAWPIWLFRESDLKNNYPYMDVDDADQIRGWNVLRDNLSPGSTLRVRKIRKRWDKTIGHWTQLYLKDLQFMGVRYWCNLEQALKYHELIVP